MKLITSRISDAETPAILLGSEVVRINDVLHMAGIPAVDSLLTFIEAAARDTRYAAALERAAQTNAARIPFDSVELLAPIPFPKRNVFCLGKNYAEHATEVKATRLSGSGIPTLPIYFTKTAAPAVPSGGEIRFSRKHTQKLDYEAELAVIIGREGVDIAPEDAEAYVFGYTVLNDVSARDLQRSHEQWFKGKNLDTFCPMGPCIVTKDAFSFPPALPISCFVNGERRQHSNTGKLIFDLPTILADLSAGTTLFPGDIISTGTPAGVGAGFEPPRFLKDGDTIECRVEGIGSLVNHVVEVG